MRINIPNQITIGRLGLAIVFFAMLTRYSAAEPKTHWVLAPCFWIYLVAALTDMLDGYLARTWKQVTAFGRVLDPVVDKVIVCGAFVFFSSSHFVAPTRGNITGVEAWMAVLILMRELLISAIRSFSESQGADFAANWVGKFKSFVQFATACVILGVLAWYEQSLAWLRVACIWATVVVTAASIVAYLHRAYSLILSPEALGAAPPTRPAEQSGEAAKRASA
ncbi:MAG: CDP-diacylglycerol--glycerol-3-phosphate 3-phosphatidyltransferase [Planctomycetes bacterium]|nr:CDP-diacylglycerol--glycerol-3-phosphate 3-phosphatidyltransferase [Planctomycetota bacterium]